jgi:hypothetical protein
MGAPLRQSGPPGGVTPVAVPDDVVLIRSVALVVWCGAVTVFPAGFEFTLLMLFDTNRTGPPAHFALHPPERGQMSWLEARYADGRHRAADLNANTPIDQPQGPHLMFQDGMAVWTEGWFRTRWWVTPLPPPGPVELTIHLNGEQPRTGTGYLDGAALADAAATAKVIWTERSAD